MASIDLRSATGDTTGNVELDDAVFGIEPNLPVMHQVVTAQLAARRQGTQSTRTRAEVRGGGAKPWRQKGTGRARQGSIRSPQWVGGGVALGPKPRSYKQRTPKKMIRLALHSALSDRAASGRLAVLDSWGIDTPSTKAAKAVLSALGAEGSVLVVLSRDDEVVWKSLRNLPEVHVLLSSELNAYDVLCADWVVFTESSLPTARPVTRGSNPLEALATAASETPVELRPEEEIADQDADGDTAADDTAADDAAADDAAAETDTEES
jgi:large subunit ribosomal protein L4